MQTVDSFLAQWATAERDGDISTLDSLITNDFTAVGPMGFMLPKVAWLARHRHSDIAYQEYNLDEIQFRPLGEIAAVVTARINTRGTHQGNPLPEAARVTLVLFAEADRWQITAIHLSFIAGTPGSPPLPGSGAPESITRHTEPQRDV